MKHPNQTSKQTGRFNGKWTVTDSTYTPDIGKKTTSGFQIIESGDKKNCGSGLTQTPCVGFYILFDGDRAGQDEIKTEWNECLRKLTFQFSESEDGGTTVNRETWTYKGGKWRGTTSWTWSNSQGDSSQGTNTFTTSGDDKQNEEASSASGA